MKRIKLTYGTARVDDDIDQETIDSLNEASVQAYALINTKIEEKRNAEQDLKSLQKKLRKENKQPRKKNTHLMPKNKKRK